MSYTPDEVIGWSTKRILSWLNTQPADGEVAWLAIAEGAAMAANSTTQNVSAARREALGELAVYSFRRATERNPKTRKGAILSEIVLRSGLIHRLGAKPNTVRDASRLWSTIEGVLAQAETAKHHLGNDSLDLAMISIDEMLKLRQAKSVLRGAELILQANEVVRPPLVDWWWNHRHRLP